MDVDSNEYAFVKVAEAASFVRAAEVLRLSPSAVSKKVDRLEQRLGVRLFRRSTRSVSLTPGGEIYFARMREIFDELIHIEAAVVSADTKPTGVVRVSCYTAFATHVFLPVLSELFELYPGIKIELVSGDRLDIAAAPVDIQILSIVPAQQKKQSYKIMDNPHLICAAPSYLERTSYPREPGDLVNHNCLILNGRSTCEDEWIFKAKEPRAEPFLIETVSGNFGGFGLSVYQATLNGLGIARLPLFVVERDLARGLLVEVLAEYAPSFGRAIYAVIPEGRQVTARHRAVISFLQQRLQPQQNMFSLALPAKS